MQSFQGYGNVVVDWPGKDNKHNRHPPKGEGVGLKVKQEVGSEKGEGGGAGTSQGLHQRCGELGCVCGRGSP